MLLKCLDCLHKEEFGRTHVTLARGEEEDTQFYLDSAILITPRAMEVVHYTAS